MRYFYDFEFLEDGWAIEPISLGIVAEDGREYYAEFENMPLTRMSVHPWIMTNVVPHLKSVTVHNDKPVWHNLSIDESVQCLRSLSKIKEDVFAFLTAADRPSLWGCYAAYDHVALAQLWGPMVQMPREIPFYTNDIQTLWEMAGKPAKPNQVNEHNALADARWNWMLFAMCQNLIADNGVVVP